MAFRRLVKRLKICPMLISGSFLMVDAYVWFSVSFRSGNLTAANVGWGGYGGIVVRVLDKSYLFDSRFVVVEAEGFKIVRMKLKRSE